MRVLRDAGTLMRAAVDATIDALKPQDEDAAAVKLARLYADQIDECTGSEDPKLGAWAARWIGPLLLACLAELGATPAARSALAKKGGTPERGETQLDRLRKAKARTGA